MGIGTLRQYHQRKHNITTIKDILGEVAEKTAFVEAVPRVSADKVEKPTEAVKVPETKQEQGQAAFESRTKDGFDPKPNPADDRPSNKKAPTTVVTNKNL